MKRLLILLSVIVVAPFGYAQGTWFDSAHQTRALGVAEGQRKPNILLIVLDDAGYGDIAGFGTSTAPTPTLKQLGDEGVRFTRFYADSTCRPARVSLLTGKQASKVAMSPDFHGISPEFETLPKQLKAAGYATYHIGKWHLGDTTMLAWPLAQGFDHWFGFLNQFYLRGPNDKGEMVPHRPTYLNPWLQSDNGKPQQVSGHLEDILADRVVTTLQELKNSQSPWFIDYWTLAPHNPATPSDLYRKQFAANKAGQYQALLKQMDDNLARVLKTLDDIGQADNTIVVVLSDNGGTNELDANNGPYAGEKAEFSEGGTRTPMIIRWGKSVAGAPAPAHYDGITAIYDVYPTLLKAAAVTVRDTDGVDVLPLVQQQEPRPPQALFWDIGTDYTYNYSVLDEQGRWRLDDQRLFDLQADPFAQHDVAKQFPEKVAELKKQFTDWRARVHRVGLQVDSLHPVPGVETYRLSGDRFRRTPGYGGWTFVSSLTPRKGESASTGLLAEQAGMWRMSLDKRQRIHIEIGDHQAVSKPVSLSTCTPLVLSTYYYRSKLKPADDHAVWVLMVGDKIVLEEKWLAPSVLPDHFEAPTFVGRGHDGADVWPGRIERPQIYNDFYYIHDPWQIQRSPKDLTASLCQQ